MSTCQQGKEKRNSAVQALPTGAKMHRVWHFQGTLRNEEERTWERVTGQAVAEVSKA